MDSKVNYTMVGTFVIVLLLALVGFGVWLSGTGNDKVYTPYVVYMHEAVSGLSLQAPVEFNGVRVGNVTSIRLNPVNPKEVRIQLDIEAGTPIDQGTVATLKMQGITGVSYLGLSAKRAHAAPLTVLPGHTLPVIASEPSLLETLSDTIERVTNNVSSLSASIKKLLSQENREALSKSLVHIESVTALLARNQDNISKSLASIQIISANSAKASAEFPEMTKDLQETLKSIRDTSDKLQATTITVDKTMKDTRVAVSGVADQVMPETVSLLGRMNSIANNLRALTQTLKQNPSVLIRGRHPASLGPGEKP